SFNMFSDSKPFKQDGVASTGTNATGTNAWSNQPRTVTGWATNPAGTNALTGIATNPSTNLAAGSGTNLDTGLGSRTPATTTGLSNCNTSTGSNLSQSTTPVGTMDRTTSSSTNWPSDTAARTPAVPQVATPATDWNRDNSAAGPRSSLGGGATEPSASYTPSPYSPVSGPSTTSSSGGTAQDSRYQTQYPSNVKTM